MKLEEFYLETEIVEVGSTIYYDHYKWEYKGETNGLHILTRRKNSKELITVELDLMPKQPKLPVGLFLKNKRSGNFVEIIDYTQMRDEIYYKIIIPNNVFKGEDLEKLSNLSSNYECLGMESPFADMDELVGDIETIDVHLSNLNDEIRELKSKRKQLTANCKHEWYKCEPENVGGNSYEQECICNICGEERINQYSSW